jgi:signal transduction histidine kinase
MRSEFARRRHATEEEMLRLQKLVPKQQSAKLRMLQEQIDAYWQSLERIVDSPQKPSLSYSLIQKEILPRREAALTVVAEIEQLSVETFQQRKSEIDFRNSRLASYVGRMSAVTLLIALLVAGLSIYRILYLERIADRQHKEMQVAESELRTLSRQLVTAQEEERRSLSRDLHDQVGQVLTALRISLGNVQLLMEAAGIQAGSELEISKRLVTQALRSTRDLAMGLRPSMLDDLGLEAALEWHVRQYAKISGVPATLHLTGPLQHLSDAQRTCVYRTVQEALNNAAKHSQAKNITVAIHSEAEELLIEIKDDGIGFDSSHRTGHGLGLLGMRERVEQLGGIASVESGNGQGTAVSVRLPLGEHVAS